MKKMKKQKTAECLAVLLHLFRKIILGWISCRGDEPHSVLCVLYKKEVTFHVIFCSVGWTQIIRWHQTHMRGCQLVAVHMLKKHKAWKELLTKEGFASLSRKDGASCVIPWMHPRWLQLVVKFLRTKCWPNNKICWFEW